MKIADIETIMLRLPDIRGIGDGNPDIPRTGLGTTLNEDTRERFRWSSL
jgi:hypothetical protein